MDTPGKLGRAPAVSVLLLCWACTIVSGGEVLGWRMNGSGRYPDADPPTFWTAGQNIVWSVPFQHGASYSSPVLVGDKLLTTAGPALVVCLDAHTGTQLWATANHVFMDILKGEELDKANAALQEVDALQRLRSKTQFALRGIRRSPDDQRKRGLPWADWTQEQRDAEIQRMLQRVEDINDKLARSEGGKYVNATTYRSGKTGDHGGPADATPVTDGKRLYMKFDSGVLVCLDVETGKRLWYTMLTADWETHHHGDHSSPCLIGNRLIVAFVNHFYILNATDGSILWKSGRIKLSHGTPVAFSVGGVDVVTVNEKFYRVSDGHVLADIHDQRLKWGMFMTPVLQDGVMYISRDGPGRSLIRAVKLPGKLDGDVLNLKVLWSKEMPRYKFDASPLIHDGLLYTVSCVHSYTHRNQPRSGELWVLDAKTGETVYVKDMTRTHLQIYNPSSPTLAGPYIYVSGGYTGKTVVFKPGRTYQEVAVNELRRQAPSNKVGASSDWMGILSTPVFRGNRMYLRHSDRMYCIGGNAKRRDTRPTVPEPAQPPKAGKASELTKLPLLWKVKVDGPGLAPVAADRGMVVIGGNVDGRDYWRACSGATGKRLWEHAYENTMEYDFGSAPRAAPLFCGHEVVCLGASGELRALHLPDGKVRWKANYRTDFLAPNPTWGFCISPVLLGDHLIVAAGGESGVLSLGPGDGKEIWEIKTNKANYADPVVTNQGGRMQVILYDQKTLLGLDPMAGKVLWKIPVENAAGYIVPTPAVIGDKLLLVDGYKGARLHQFDKNGILSKAPVVINEDVTSDLSSPFVRGDLILIGNGALTCMDARTIETLWATEADESLQADILHIVCHEQKTYVFSRDGHVLLIEANRTGGSILLKAKLSGATYSRPAIVGNRLFARDDSFLYCYKLTVR